MARQFPHHAGSPICNWILNVAVSPLFERKNCGPEREQQVP